MHGVYMREITYTDAMDGVQRDVRRVMTQGTSIQSMRWHVQFDAHLDVNERETN